MYDLTALEWGMAILGSICIGLSKGAFPGMGILAIGLYAHIFQPAESLGIILIILFLANIVAVIIFRRFANWIYIGRLMPFILVGVLIGYFFLLYIPTVHMGRLIGLMLLVMTGIHFYRQYRLPINLNSENNQLNLSTQFFSFPALFFGLLSGFSSMVANAAGPITVIYLMSMGLEKYRFISTMAWLYLILNAFKIPFHLALGNINVVSLKLSGILGSIAIATVLISPLLVKHIPQKAFNFIIWSFVVIASLKLVF